VKYFGLFFNDFQHFPGLFNDHRKVQRSADNDKFYTGRDQMVCVVITSLSTQPHCLKIVQRNIQLMQNNNIMAKSRFTKYFYFLSTVFVDNFVDNEEINQWKRDLWVYNQYTPSSSDPEITLTNQRLKTSLRTKKIVLPVILASKKIVHKSVCFPLRTNENGARPIGTCPTGLR